MPLIIFTTWERFNGKDLLINGHGEWCPQWHESFSDRDEYLILTVDDLEGKTIERSTFGTTFMVLAGVYAALDAAWILSVWGAASVGTPTQTTKRDEYLR